MRGKKMQESVNLRIGFLGAGNMARAIAGGIIRKGLVTAANVLASDVSESQRALFTESTGAACTASNVEVLRSCDVIIFAVKPFNVGNLCEEIRPAVNPGQHLFVSICAGIRTSFLEERLGGQVRVVRVMPNTPALIGCGATAVAAGKYATNDDLSLVCSLFDAVGVTVRLPEDKLDIVTGLSGSGPAYVFYFAEGMIAAAEKLGLDREAAELLVKQTILGAARLAVETGKSLRELGESVTTKGGTTEAGLRALDRAGFFTALEECVAAATARSAELSHQA
jgi:pyrroline-5-carboxylate reductase